MTRHEPLPEHEGLSFLTACPVRGCDVRIDDDGLREHAMDHLALGEAAQLVDALVLTHHVLRRVIRIGLAAAAADESPLARGILDHLAADGTPIHVALLADEVGERLPRVRSCVRQLAARGVVMFEKKTGLVAVVGLERVRSR